MRCNMRRENDHLSSTKNEKLTSGNKDKVLHFRRSITVPPEEDESNLNVHPKRSSSDKDIKHSMKNMEKNDSFLDNGKELTEHLIVIQHGLHGSKDDFHYLIKLFSTGLDQKEIWIHISTVNSDTLLRTHDGIDAGGLRLAEDILELVKQMPKLQKFSIIGHSLGGLYARYCVGVLHARGFFTKVQPMNFVTLSTPHLGIRRPFRGTLNKLHNVIAPRLFGRTSQQLTLNDFVSDETCKIGQTNSYKNTTCMEFRSPTCIEYTSPSLNSTQDTNEKNLHVTEKLSHLFFSKDKDKIKKLERKINESGELDSQNLTKEGQQNLTKEGELSSPSHLVESNAQQDLNEINKTVQEIPLHPLHQNFPSRKFKFNKTYSMEEIRTKKYDCSGWLNISRSLDESRRSNFTRMYCILDGRNLCLFNERNNEFILKFQFICTTIHLEIQSETDSVVINFQSPHGRVYLKSLQVKDRMNEWITSFISRGISCVKVVLDSDITTTLRSSSSNSSNHNNSSSSSKNGSHRISNASSTGENSLLVHMCQGHFLEALLQFKCRTLYANVFFDMQVPYTTSSIRSHNPYRGDPVGTPTSPIYNHITLHSIANSMVLRHSIFPAAKIMTNKINDKSHLVNRTGCGNSYSIASLIFPKAPSTTGKRTKQASVSSKTPPYMGDLKSGYGKIVLDPSEEAFHTDPLKESLRGILVSLQALGWRRIDVVFDGVLAHEKIIAKRANLHSLGDSGFDVVCHIIDTLLI